MLLPESDIAPETMLPVQLYDRPAGGARLHPEKRLQIAVLADATLTFHRFAGSDGRRARRLFAEVEAWFGSEDAHGPFTFVAICQSLALDPGYIRRGLREWRSRPGAAEREVSIRRADGGSRHQVVLGRLRRVA